MAELSHKDFSLKDLLSLFEENRKRWKMRSSKRKHKQTEILKLKFASTQIYNSVIILTGDKVGSIIEVGEQNECRMKWGQGQAPKNAVRGT